MKINSNKTGLALGITFATCHLLWVVALFLGLGKTWLNLMWGLHFVKVDYQVMSPNLTSGIVGVILAFVVGYITGWFFAFVWEQIKK